MAEAARDIRGGRVRAPSLASADAWLNTEKALTPEMLRGRVVLLDFWTYCCINCLHVLPDLKYLEEKYADSPFVVIGVHSGKFAQEKDAENIRRAILRHNITHPVAVDSDYEIWNAYGIRAWPSFVLIDPEGYAVGSLSGEGHRRTLDEAIGRLLKEHRAKGTLAEPMAFALERAAAREGMLNFPGKVLADGETGRLFVSDTNHHRIVVSDFEGRVQEVIGDGQAGLVDGGFGEARFRQPQGLALSADGRVLYVADTENHAVRAVDFEAETVVTVAGTGEQSRDYSPSGRGRSTALSSPWDLARVNDKLLIAMAGTHQIWVMNLESERVTVFAGTGMESGNDGPLRRATFAQPSGLASDGVYLYVADSEISSIREVRIERNGKVRTLAGSGGLFEFGLRDGVGEAARFQHPLGVALAGDTLYVSDTFNSRIRAIDLGTRQVRTFFPADKSKADDGDGIGLFEPGGLSLADNILYIADTNHHRIVAVDVEARQARILDIKLPEPTR